MTKKDYILIAKVFKSVNGYNSAEKAMKLDIVNRLAKALKLENNRFDEDKFAEACGLEVAY